MLTKYLRTSCQRCISRLWRSCCCDNILTHSDFPSSLCGKLRFVSWLDYIASKRITSNFPKGLLVFACDKCWNVSARGLLVFACDKCWNVPAINLLVFACDKCWDVPAKGLLVFACDKRRDVLFKCLLVFACTCWEGRTDCYNCWWWRIVCIRELDSEPATLPSWERDRLEGG